MRPGRVHLYGGLLPLADRLHLGIHLQKAGFGPHVHRRRFAGFCRRRDDNIDDVVVDHHRRERDRPAAAASVLFEEPIVDQDVAFQATNAGSRHLARERVQACQGIRLGKLAVAAAVGINVVVVAKGQPSSGIGATAEGQIALGHENQIPRQLPVL